MYKDSVGSVLLAVGSVGSGSVAVGSVLLAVDSDTP